MHLRTGLVVLVLVACRPARPPTQVDDVAVIAIAAPAPRPAARGHRVARDVNGDGFDDAVLSDRQLYFGGRDGLRRDRAVAIPLPDHPDPMIAAAALVGDVDGDGFADVIAGDPGCPDLALAISPCGIGRAYLFRGSRAGLVLDAPAQVLTGAGHDRRFGARITALGDVDGDGRDDVAIADGRLAVDDVVHVYLGADAGLAPVAIDLPGGIPIAAGDVDGDGRDDLALLGQDRAYLYRGGKDGLVAARASRIARPPAMRFMMTGAGGDLDGDGFADLALGVDVEDAAGALLPNGVVILRGGADGLAAAPAVTLRGDQVADGFGGGLATADLDGDGRDDLVIASTCAIMNAARTSCERARIDVHLGRAAGLDPARAASAAPIRTAFTIGEELLTLGDVDGDRHADVAFGAFVFRGAPGGVATTAPPSL